MFLRQLTNEWGEDEAFSYFEKLTENILQYTSSGSGPVNALVQGEAAIALGMTSQAVVEINNGVDLDILFYDDLVTDDEDLCIPHHDMRKRDFVLKPMAEIAPYKVHPVYNKRIEEMLEELENN